MNPMTRMIMLAAALIMPASIGARTSDVPPPPFDLPCDPPPARRAHRLQHEFSTGHHNAPTANPLGRPTHSRRIKGRRGASERAIKRYWQYADDKMHQMGFGRYAGNPPRAMSMERIKRTNWSRK